MIVAFGLGYGLGFALRAGLSRLRRVHMRRRFARHGQRAARPADLKADAAGNADGPGHRPADTGRAEEASRLGARLEATLAANSLIWVDIHEGGGARSNGTLVGSFQPELTDGLGLRLVRTDGSAFAVWDLRDFDLSLADSDIFGRHVVLTGRDGAAYSLPALPHEDAERLLGILTEARESASAGPPVVGKE